MTINIPRLFCALLLAGIVGCAQVGAALKSAMEQSAAPAAGARPNGAVHEDVFYSAALGVRKHLVVYLPPSYGRDTTRRYPVAYYLHGLSGTETDWLSKGSIDATADSLFSRGTPEMIIVLPDGDDGWYTTWIDQWPLRACADTIRNESPERYCAVHQRYDDYVARDVVHHIDSTYRTRADRDNRGIGGLSMGGYGAVSIALRYPDIFAAAASHSGVLSPRYIGPHPFAEPARYAANAAELRTAGGGFWSLYARYWGTDVERWKEADPALIAESVQRRGVRMPSLFFDCGRDDGFVDQNRAFDMALTRLSIRHTYNEWPGAHTWRYWSTHVAESLAWMARQIN
jgi:putative tributyrin esterase